MTDTITKDEIWRNEILKAKSVVIISKDGKKVTVYKKDQRKKLLENLTDDNIVAYFGRIKSSFAVIVDLSYNELCAIALVN